jgi:hypothetical protein
MRAESDNHDDYGRKLFGASVFDMFGSVHPVSSTK